ncbi:MAG: single-stranded DNA-binding protein [Opitutales bacterium]
MNQTIMTGNLTADIETREVKSKSGEQHLSKFTLACDDGERTTFIPVDAWNMPHLAQYLHKGSKVLVSGALRQDNWETDAGEKRNRIVLTAYKVEFLDPAPEKQSGKNPPSRSEKRGPKTYGRRQAA